MGASSVSYLIYLEEHLFFSSYYTTALETLNNAPADIKKVMMDAPKVYEFNSQFDSSKSSVAYTGQTFRQVLINDIYGTMNSAKRQGYTGNRADAMAWLNSYFNYMKGRGLTPHTS